MENFKRKKIEQITVEEMNELFVFIKKSNYVIKFEEPSKIGASFCAYIVDKISKLELTFYDPSLSSHKTRTYVCDKTEGEVNHIVNGMESFRILSRYFKVPKVSTKETALFSPSGILYWNKKYNETRNMAYGYDMNSAFSWGMLQDMPSKTENGPSAFNRTLQEDEIGFLPTGELCTNVGELAFYIFKKEESPFKKFVQNWYSRKKNAKTREDKLKAKDILVMSVGYLQRVNFWYRAAIIGYCNNFIRKIIKKYPNDILLSNTDSIVSKSRIPELEDNLGKEIGQWKFEHNDWFAYKRMNYQWGVGTPTYRGIPKGWFKQFKKINGRDWDILKDTLPVGLNVYKFNEKNVMLERINNGEI